MTDDSGLQATDARGEATPTAAADGGPVVSAEPAGDYREQLRSRRWDAAPLENPEVEKTDPRIAVAAIVILGAITLVVIVAGYASGFWG